MEIRNIAIIAHVDHGKTSITDALMRHTGATKDSLSTMDSNDLEQERGITIYAKNASMFYKGTKINIVDTPGHADFGSEVERVLRSIDSVLLVVDAQEGPMPQTKFVLKKSLELGLKPLVILNKIDKDAARPKEVIDEILELFMDLGANNEQLDFEIIYTTGKDGVSKFELKDETLDMTPLLDSILLNGRKINLRNLELDAIYLFSLLNKFCKKTNGKVIIIIHTNLNVQALSKLSFFEEIKDNINALISLLQHDNDRIILDVYKYPFSEISTYRITTKQMSEYAKKPESYLKDVNEMVSDIAKEEQKQ